MKLPVGRAVPAENRSISDSTRLSTIAALKYVQPNGLERFVSYFVNTDLLTDCQQFCMFDAMSADRIVRSERQSGTQMTGPPTAGTAAGIDSSVRLGCKSVTVWM
jgi:hypothetical protein